MIMRNTHIKNLLDIPFSLSKKNKYTLQNYLQNIQNIYNINNYFNLSIQRHIIKKNYIFFVIYKLLLNLCFFL